MGGRKTKQKWTYDIFNNILREIENIKNNMLQKVGNYPNRYLEFIQRDGKSKLIDLPFDSII